MDAIARLLAALESASASLEAGTAGKRQAIAEAIAEARQACDEYLTAARERRGDDAEETR